MSVTRREFVTRSGLLLSSALALPSITGTANAAGFKPGRRPHRIIHLVADGMSTGTLTCADLYSWMVRQRPLAWTELYRRPGAASSLVNMRSLNSSVTDSAAASSSWGSGTRVRNGSLNVLPDGRNLRTLCALLADAGWARGLVTTTEITHATPAGFAASVGDRGAATAIATQYLERQLDVLLGGGEQYFAATKRSDKRDLKAEYRAAGYQVMETKTDLEQASLSQRWLGIFASGHMPFSLDHAHDAKLRSSTPTLAQMTRRALERLDRAGPFLLQVEGGRVDHAAHANDAATAMCDMIAFDEALEACLEYQQQQPETLIVVTTDHGNANLGLNGMGSSYGDCPRLFANLTRVKKSFETLSKDLQKIAGKDGLGQKKLSDGKTTRDVIRIAPAELSRCLAEATGYEMPAGKAEWFSKHLAGEVESLYDMMNSPSALLGQALANYFGIGWTGSAHTADFVPLVACGPGAERFQGLLQNTDLFAHYLHLARIQFRNPQVPLLAESAPSASDAEHGNLV